MRKRKAIDSIIEICIPEGAVKHSGLSQLIKTVEKEAISFQHVKHIIVFLNGNSEHDQLEIIKTVNNCMITFQVRLEREIKENTEYLDGYHLTSHIERLQEIKVVHDWMALIRKLYS